MRREVSVAIATVGIALASAGSAAAWTWGTLSTPILMTGGGGYGSSVQTGYSTGKLTGTYLKDTATGDGRVYVKNNATGPGGSYFSSESGRRADGGASYANMGESPFSSGGTGWGVASFSYTIKLCRDKPFEPDPCSDTKRSHQGL